ncbi:MAG: hypothetical protein CME93_06260 [Hyphomonadaceae bacterium]|nr:hypothetical protein [Hyphomonadaceae bacterium]OUX93799.1 MAG: hypothetical protein CBB77_07740 [Hyphomonas sp. TMED17]CAI8406493.1 MAG: Uncharacterised protein [Hyphomonas sp. TMED17]
MVLAQLFTKATLLAARSIRLILTLAMLSLSSPALMAQDRSDDGWSVCNYTSYIIETAIGHFDEQRTVINGWSRLRPGACEIVLAAPLKPGVHYLHGRSSIAYHDGQRLWRGDVPLCIDPTGSFSVENMPDCSVLGLTNAEFIPVMIEDERSWETLFTETENWNRDKAAAAGVQRLLDSAGVYSGQIDGYIGRSTRRSIGNFLRSKNLDASTSDADLMDILEQTAVQRGRNVGLKFCNRTSHALWAAMARESDGEGESQGWWQIGQDKCVKVIDRPMPDETHFAFAEMQTEDGKLWRLKNGNEPFCLSRAKFVITGRTQCEASAYRTGQFIETAAVVDNSIVVEFFDDDFVDVSHDR